MKYVEIEQTGKTYKVTIDIGSKVVTSNLPKYQVEAYIRNSIVNIIQAYVNQRRQILIHHGGHLTHEKEQSLRRLQRMIDGSSKFKLRDLPEIIQRFSDDLFNIMPGRCSKFWRHDTQVLADLHNWAYDTILTLKRHEP